MFTRARREIFIRALEIPNNRPWTGLDCPRNVPASHRLTSRSTGNLFLNSDCFMCAVTSSSSNGRRFDHKYTSMACSDISLIQFTTFLTGSGVQEWLAYLVKAFINLLMPTSHVMHQQVYYLTIVGSAHNVFIWEQTVTCATYSINWLVFITEMKSVYSAVRTGSLNKAVCASSL